MKREAKLGEGLLSRIYKEFLCVKRKPPQTWAKHRNGHFTGDGSGRSNSQTKKRENKKRCSTSLVTRKIHIKLRVR